MAGTCEIWVIVCDAHKVGSKSKKRRSKDANIIEVVVKIVSSTKLQKRYRDELHTLVGTFSGLCRGLEHAKQTATAKSVAKKLCKQKESKESDPMRHG